MSEQFQDHRPPAAPARAKARRMLFALTVILFGLSAAGQAPVQAHSGDDGAWIGTWSASPQPVWEPDFFAPVNMPRALRNQTIRQVARISLGGEQVRVELSNEYGEHPLVIGAAHVALADENGAIKPGTDRALTFGGNPSVTVPPGAPILSDPVDMPVEPLTEVAVSLFLPEITPATTWHNDGRQTAYISGEGNFAKETTFEPVQTIQSRIFLSGIMVDAADDARAIVLFGDSITDGDGSSLDANHRWPDFLAERLHQADAKVAVLNEGISGARILRDRMGDNALARFDRDVLSHPHADTVVLMMGINDIGWPGTLLVPEGEPAPAAEDVITGYKQLIERAHANGMRIIGATLTPFADTFEGTPLYGYYDETKEAKRQAINDWIRTSGAFDGVIDFDAVTRDPASPKHIQAAYDKGDHLHPNDAGYKAMAESVDLKLLGVNP
ncbi:MAG TPA: SGNH/GDSL hydrolase family protein [Geminicoccus sp.]|uniref:SGNH/GDSL hydrolase family protein n=1 Tax=Geminicoccus sp. TaxID=2024832 RepID=UPI002C8249F0|nr:SGNH/GDSL hydrolase family protein [Geminicoccus sp.]HWL67430.1 SGNH/GDSL hydrolase family protein [Geminicoccus sp.]